MLRERQRLHIVEEGGKATVRMLVPVSLLILPALFVVVLRFAWMVIALVLYIRSEADRSPLLSKAQGESEALARLAPEDPEVMPLLPPQQYVPVNAWFESTSAAPP